MIVVLLAKDRKGISPLCNKLLRRTLPSLAPRLDVDFRNLPVSDTKRLDQAHVDCRKLKAISALPGDDLLHGALLVVGGEPFEIVTEPVQKPLSSVVVVAGALDDRRGEFSEVDLRSVCERSWWIFAFLPPMQREDQWADQNYQKSMKES
jgi:hypothetical protein